MLERDAIIGSSPLFIYILGNGRNPEKSFGGRRIEHILQEIQSVQNYHLCFQTFFRCSNNEGSTPLHAPLTGVESAFPQNNHHQPFKRHRTPQSQSPACSSFPIMSSSSALPKPRLGKPSKPKTKKKKQNQREAQLLKLSNIFLIDHRNLIPF